MNREQAKQVLANMKLVEAFANGDEIQILSGGGIWNDIGECATFTARPEFYRIKPKKLKLWAIVNAKGEVLGTWNNPVQKEHLAGWDKDYPYNAPHRIVHLTEAS